MEEDQLLEDLILIVEDQSLLDLKARKLKEACEPKITSTRVRPSLKQKVKPNHSRTCKTQQIINLTPAFIKMRLDSSRIYQIFMIQKILIMLVIEFLREKGNTEVHTKML